MLQTPIPSEESGSGIHGARSIWVSTAVLVLLGSVVLGLMFQEAVVGAVNVWYNSRAYNHCFLVLPISLYLIWDRRSELVRMVPRPNFWALALLVPLGLLWLAAHVAGVLEAQQLLLIAMVQAMLLAILGWQVYRLLLFPLLYLFFLVPTGEFLVPSLQNFTAGFVVHGLHLLGIPVYSDGVFITIPNGRFEVAEACAGLRFLIASVAFGFLYAYVVYRSWGRRLLFIALSLVVPLFANGLRALGIVLLAHFSNNTIAVGFDHIIYGWFFFSLVTLALIWFGYMLREGPIEMPSGTVIAAVPARWTPGRLAAVAFLALALVAAPRAFAGWRDSSMPMIDAKALVAPRVAAPWAPAAGTPDSWRPLFPGVDAQLRQDYVAGDKRVYLYIAFYAKQRYGAKVVSSENRMADDKRWTRSASGSIPAMVEGKPLTLITERMEGASGKRVVWSWYWVNGHFTASRLVAKLLQAQAEILGGDRSAALIAVSADAGSAGEEKAELRDFLKALGPIRPMLERVARQ